LNQQKLKYGREVLRTRSGTCINLALLYATVAEAAGLDSGVMLIHGHAFPAVRLPQSGRLVFVESTGCGGGTLATSADFLKACQAAANSYRQAAADGRLIEIWLRQLRRRGLSPPELPDAGRAPLKEWNITLPEVASVADARQQPLPPPPPVLSNPLLGVWEADTEKGKVVFLFHGNGTFRAGQLQGQYALNANKLTLAPTKGERMQAVLGWATDFNAFDLLMGDQKWHFSRRRAEQEVVEVTEVHNAVQRGKVGVQLRVHLRVVNAPGLPLLLGATFADSRGQPLTALDRDYSTGDHVAAACAEITPMSEAAEWKEVVLFIPYSALTQARGRSSVSYRVAVWSPREGGSLAGKAGSGTFQINQ
jgi:hypothetical protein